MSKRHEEKCTIPTAKHLSSQMVWGAMSMPDTDVSYFLPSKTTMNGSLCLNLMCGKLKTPMDDHRCVILMHDEPSCQELLRSV